MDETGDQQPEGEQELRRLQERLAFYESFHQVIQENIARSSDLLQQAAATRELARQQVAGAQARAAAEREQRRELLSTLVADVAGLQAELARLADRIKAALAAVESAPVEVTPQPGESTSDEGERLAAQPRAEEEETAPQPDVASESPPVAKEREGRAPSAAEVEVGQGMASPVTVLVHGVPRAAAALSLQRHLAELPHVEGVEAREYAAGILRLHVLARRPLAVADLDGWDAGVGLTPVHVLDDVLEVRLPGAAGF